MKIFRLINGKMVSEDGQWPYNTEWVRKEDIDRELAAFDATKKQLLIKVVELEKAKEIFQHMSIRENWSDDNISVKRTERSAEQDGIFLYSWGRSPWMVAREFLDNLQQVTL